MKLPKIMDVTLTKNTKIALMLGGTALVLGAIYWYLKPKDVTAEEAAREQYRKEVVAKTQTSRAATEEAGKAWSSSGRGTTYVSPGLPAPPTTASGAKALEKPPKRGDVRFQGFDIGEAPSTGRGNTFGAFEIASLQPRGAR